MEREKMRGVSKWEKVGYNKNISEWQRKVKNNGLCSNIHNLMCDFDWILNWCSTDTMIYQYQYSRPSLIQTALYPRIKISIPFVPLSKSCGFIALTRLSNAGHTPWVRFNILKLECWILRYLCKLCYSS